MQAEPVGAWPEGMSPPRLGLAAEVPTALATATWFGLGPGENYSDSRAAARLGTHTRTAEKMDTPYIFPQDHGNRGGVRRLWLSGGGKSLGVEVPAGAQDLSFSLHRYDQEQLTAAAHRHGLRPSERLHLHLDARVRGLGSASCGPPLPSRYEVPLEPVSFEVVIG